VDTPRIGAVDLQELIREALPYQRTKRLARLLGVPLNTAKSLAYNRLSKRRAREVLAALREEVVRQHAASERMIRLIDKLSGEDS
jgi:hypothetical protein